MNNRKCSGEIAVEVITLLVAIATLALAAWKFSSIDVKLADLQSQTAEEELSYRLQAALGISGQLSFHNRYGETSANLFSDDFIVTARINLENLRRLPIKIKQIDFTLAETEIPESLARFYPHNRSTMRDIVIADDVDGEQSLVTKSIEFATSEIFAIHTNSRTDEVEIVKGVEGEPTRITISPRNGEILGGQQRAQIVDFLVLHPAKPQLWKLEAKITIEEIVNGNSSQSPKDAVFHWSDWFAIGGLLNRSSDTTFPDSPAPAAPADSADSDSADSGRGHKEYGRFSGRTVLRRSVEPSAKDLFVKAC